MEPLLLSGLAAVLYAAGWILFLSRIDGVRNEFLLFRKVSFETLTAGTRISIPVMVSVLVLCIVLTLTASSVGAKNPVGRFAPPQDFQSVAQIDLSSQPYSNVTLAELSLDKPAYIGVYVVIRDINTTYFDLRITGPAGYSSVILHGEGYRADQDGGLWEQDLKPGDYRLVLTSAKAPGAVSVYLNDR
jgi:hypothetical protein